MSALAAAAFVCLFVKYRYIVTIATTSFTGSFLFWDVLADRYGVPLTTLWAVLTGVFALFSQILINHDIDGKESIALPQGLYFVKIGNTTQKVIIE